MLIAGWVLCTSAFHQSAIPPIFFGRNDSVYLFSQGKESLVVKHATAPAPSPDGKQLAFLREGNLYLWDLAKGTTKRCSELTERATDLPSHDVTPSWDDKSRFVLFSHADRYSVTRRGIDVKPMFGEEKSSRSIWNVYWYWLSKPPTKSGLSLFLGNSTSGSSSFSLASSLAAAFSPDGRRVAFCRNGDLWMASLEPSSIHGGIKEASWDEARVLATGTLEGGTRATNETSMIFRISWSPDGNLLALSSDRYGASGSSEVTILKTDHLSEKGASFSGSDASFIDGDRVVYTKASSRGQDVWVRSLDSGEEKLLISHASNPAVAK